MLKITTAVHVYVCARPTDYVRCRGTMCMYMHCHTAYHTYTIWSVINMAEETLPSTMSLLYAPTEASLFGHIKWTFGQTRRTMDATVQGFEVSDCFLYVYESTVDGDGEHGEEIRSEQRNDKRQKQPTGTITRSTLCTCRPTCKWFVVYKLHLQSFVEYPVHCMQSSMCLFELSLLFKARGILLTGSWEGVHACSRLLHCGLSSSLSRQPAMACKIRIHTVHVHHRDYAQFRSV